MFTPPFLGFEHPSTYNALVNVFFDGDTIRGYTPADRPWTYFNADGEDTEGLWQGKYRLGDLTWL